MDDEIEDYVDAPVSDDSYVTPERIGHAYPVAWLADDGLPGEAYGAPCMAPLVWGSCSDPDYDSIDDWVVVTDLGPLEGKLAAAWWNGKLFLKMGQIQEDAGSSGIHDSGGDDASGFVASFGDDGLPEDRPCAMYPQLFICPEEARDSYFGEEGMCRANACWEVLANFSTFCGSPPIRVADDGSASWNNDACVTIWMAICGNVIAFYTSSGPRYADGEGTFAESCPWMKYSAFGRMYSDDEEELEALSRQGGPWLNLWTAPMPWESAGGGGASPASPGGEDVIDAFDGGNLSAGVGEDGLADMAPVAQAQDVYVCPRFHLSNSLGITALYITGAWTQRPSLEEYLGFASVQEACRAVVTGEKGVEDYGLVPFDTADDFRFDPWAVEANAWGFLYMAGSVTVSQEFWKPFALPYALLAEYTGNGISLAIGGSSLDGTLLTSSCYAAIPEEGGEAVPEGYVPPPLANVFFPPFGGGDGGSGGDGDGEEDDDDTPPSSWVYLPEGIYYQGKKGVEVKARREKEKNGEGKVGNVTYLFTVSPDVGSVTIQEDLAYSVSVLLSVGNCEDSYMYQGREQRMYYGFSSSSFATAATLRYRSSYMYADTDPKSALCSMGMYTRAAAKAEFLSEAYATSEALLESNILQIRDTGRYRTEFVRKGVRRKFRIYTLALNTGRLKEILRYMAIDRAPLELSLSPPSITGQGGNIAPPVVYANVQSVRRAGDNPYPAAAVTGILQPALSFSYSSASSSLSLSGSGSWHYDAPDGSVVRAVGSISGAFSLLIPSYTIEQ